MISVTELKNGTVFEDQGQLFQVLSYAHIKLGRGSATIKVKVKNLKSGSTTEKSFISGAKVQDISVFKKDLQFLYKDSDNLYFMDPKSFEQVSISLAKFSDQSQYLKEGENFSISFFNDEPLSLNLPPKMEFKVRDTGPSLRGNSATNIYKEAILENGIKTKVPLFIKVGDSIRIDTKTSQYSEKV
ncbi:MAG: elongation factor P [Candidatus Levybacteria bacterium]|nr:elongation factor P [Candidatus Levybacteria bacterium]MBI2190172.1 elongation factor P [Candidatus Levybacteria bacterium]MBI3069984.1 elongation factor P [Candidatus Levybacteria bacterium]MBI3092679.1 elongation factor P [Candidatus Levybacteria bacterium]